MTRTNAPSPATTAEGEPWTTRRLLAWMSEAFTKANLDSPRLQAEMLLAHVIGCQRLKLFTEPERRATDQERTTLRSLVARALRHEPIDYLVGERSFFGMMFKVDPRVLVPRPSTETVVEFVLQEARRAGSQEADRSAVVAQGSDLSPGRSPGRGPEERVFNTEDRGPTLSAFKPSEDDLEEGDEAELDKPAVPKPAAAPPKRHGEPLHQGGTPVARKSRAGGPPWRIADIGTGSGCIAIALAKNLSRATIIATDLSTDALDLAIDNAARHAVSPRIEFRHGHLLDPLDGDRFDIIASNPPYIPDDEWDAVPPNVRDHEPTIALRGGPDGMDFATPLIQGAMGALKPSGLLVVEVATSRAEAAGELARQAGFIGVEVLRDCEGLPRVVIGRRG